MIVSKIGGKIVKTAQCTHTHTYEWLLQLSVGLGLSSFCVIFANLFLFYLLLLC